jgi:hypothetical protein
MDCPLLDHRSPEFGTLTKSLLPPLRTVFDTAAGEIFIYPSSGTGAWEAALVNTLRPGDRVLVFQYGQFSAGAAQIARNLGYTVDEVVLRWGDAPTPALVEERLRADDPANPYAALLLVHNETATGVLCDLPGIRAALDRVGHGALLVVDASAPEFPAAIVAPSKSLLVWNKIDLLPTNVAVPATAIATNAISGGGLAELHKEIVRSLVPISLAGRPFIFTRRQAELVEGLLTLAKSRDLS